MVLLFRIVTKIQCGIRTEISNIHFQHEDNGGPLVSQLLVKSSGEERIASLLYRDGTEQTYQTETESWDLDTKNMISFTY